MKKILFSLFAIFLILILGLAFLWTQKNSMISHFLSKNFGAPVSMKDILFFKRGCKISDFLLQNVSPCKTSNALFVQSITCKASIRSLIRHTVEIESIHLKDIFLGIEFFTPSGDRNNWTLLLSNNRSNKKSSRPYLIRSLVFDNIHVTITDQTGKTKKIPPIGHLEFHDISDASGIPLDELEKAIFHSMIESVFKKLGISAIKKMLTPSSIPKLFHFPFSANENSSPSEDSLETEL